MPRGITRVLAAVALLAAAVLASAAPAVARPAAPTNAAPPLPAGLHRACAWPPKPGTAACMAIGRTDTKKSLGARPAVAALDQGYGPADLRDAYDLPSASAKPGQTVAIVDAFDDPTAESDMAVYRAQYGLPACTTANGCFKKVLMANSPPPADGGWSTEMALDLDMVSAICPDCHIVLVEANSNGQADLGDAEAAAMQSSGVHYVSNSWGMPEGSAEVDLYPFGSQQGIAVTVSSGDSGYGADFPASDPYVTAVGGTSLLHATNARGWDEIAWIGGGSGCSGISAGGKPPWQADSGCGNRTEADVAADADPYTGVYTYNTQANDSCVGWCVWGGTSAAAPIIAAVYALAGPPADNDPAYSLYAHTDRLNDIVGGTNSYDPCSPDYLCNAGPGYDGPTGLGTPNGTGAFVATKGPWDYWP
jgi:hypothetical protein